MFSALALEADMSEPSRHFRVVPQADLRLNAGLQAPPAPA